MVTEYVDCTELKRLIEDRKLKTSALRHYLRKKGILITASNVDDFAEQIYTIMLGCGEIEDLRELINTDGNYEKSMMLKIEIKALAVGESITEIIADEVNRLRTTKMDTFSIDSTVSENDEVQVKFSYNRKLLGRNKFLADEKRYLQMNIRKSGSNQAIVDIRQQSTVDASNAVQFLEKLISSNTELGLKHVNLALLSDKNKVEFFDRVAAYNFSHWRLETITGITVKRGSMDDSEDVDEWVDSETDGTDAADAATLTGITQAVLNGKGLRSNEFVQNSLKQDYYIAAMKYRYLHKTDLTAFVLSLGFKGADVKIEIDKTYYEEDDGRLYIQPMIRTEQNDIILEFQKVVAQIFEELLLEQKQ